MAFELETITLKQNIKEEETQIKVIERSAEIKLEEEEILRKTQVLEATVKIPAQAEKYRSEKVSFISINFNYLLIFI